jgi:hypothetical protein
MLKERDLTVAVMQPYFFPYAGYFRLFALADIFVILDCAQFPRRGWVHRNNFKKKSGASDWLTLPIRKCSQNTQIKDLQFDQNDKLRDFSSKSKTFIYHDRIKKSQQELLFNFRMPVVDLLQIQIEHIVNCLSFNVEVIRSSQLGIDRSAKGESKIIEIVKQVGGKRYLNLSGGKDLYDESNFSKNGIKLDIFEPYVGSKTNMLERVILEDIQSITDEIHFNLKLTNLHRG